jgi:hypothetical protein
VLGFRLYLLLSGAYVGLNLLKVARKWFDFRRVDDGVQSCGGEKLD